MEASIITLSLSLILLVVISCPLVNSQQCISNCFSRKNEFEECPVETNNHTGSNSDMVYITLAGDYQYDVSSLIIPLILALHCNQASTVWSSFPDDPPYCASIVMTEPVECSQCINNCTQLSLHVMNRYLNVSVSPASIVNTLQLESSQIALKLAGIPYVGASTGGRGILEVVPIGSWVCLALGFITSSLILLKPIWWDRLILLPYRKITKKT
jgi:hypothetical protein